MVSGLPASGGSLPVNSVSADAGPVCAMQIRYLPALVQPGFEEPAVRGASAGGLLIPAP